MTRISGVPTPIQHDQRESFVDSPFEDHINMVDMPKRFMFPSMRLFDGTSNPDDHVAHYKQKMLAVSVPRAQREACMCKGFELSLSGPTLQWYTSLPNASIGSFADLHLTFLEQFASSRRAEKTP